MDEISLQHPDGSLGCKDFFEKTNMGTVNPNTSGKLEVYEASVVSSKSQAVNPTACELN